ncbi:MAG: hypothetical protein H5U07_10595 [Candidatus Aminicenantes bacterium]|nr:hypothetical protein [Candidatus Aminicenantes bacterium]
MISAMDLILYEDTVRYDKWVKVLLIFPVLLFLVLSLLFYLNSQGQNIFPKEKPQDSLVGAAVMFGAAVFVLVIYSLAFPRSIAVAQDGIVLRFKAFSWKVPFRKVKTIGFNTGLPSWRTTNLATTFRNYVEIVKNNGARLRISPAHPEQFLEYATRALEEWRTYHPEGRSY